MKGIRLPNPAMVVAMLALLVALSGTAVAAGIVPKAKVALNALKLQGKTAAQVTLATLAAANLDDRQQYAKLGKHSAFEPRGSQPAGGRRDGRRQRGGTGAGRGWRRPRAGVGSTRRKRRERRRVGGCNPGQGPTPWAGGRRRAPLIFRAATSLPG